MMHLFNDGNTCVTPNIVVQYHEWAMVCGGEGGRQSGAPV